MKQIIPLYAQITVRDLDKVSVFVLDAKCTIDTNVRELGFLTVTLQVSNLTPKIDTEGDFHSYNGNVQDKKWHLIAIDLCQKLEQKFLDLVGTRVVTKGKLYEKEISGQTSEPIYEYRRRCTGGLLDGRDCRNERVQVGTEIVPYRYTLREIVLNFFGQQIVN